MSRPLELNIYPQPVADQVVRFKDLSTGQVNKRYMYQDGGLLSSSPPRLDTSKRFTNAELAAEFEAARCDWMVHLAKGSYWAPVDETWPTDYEPAANRAMTLLRFATLPHYDEVTA